MRFTTSRALDSIERRLTTDPVLAAAVVDLPSVVRHTGLDDGRPASLLRLGMVIDALSRHLSDDSVAVYPVAGRQLLSDVELTSNEKMVIRRWTDDGLAEAVPEPDERALEVAELVGLPLVSRRDYGAYRGRFPGIVGTARLLVPVPGSGGAVLAAAGGSPASAPARPHPVLRRRWRCPEPGCASFGGTDGADGQPPVSLRHGRPTCPRHGHPLGDVGPAPQAVAVVVVVRGTGRHRFVVREDRPVVVGRNPDEPGVSLGRLLDEQSAPLVSRNHLRLDVVGGALTVADTSTNGTVVLCRTAAVAPPQRVRLTRGERRPLGEWDTVELHSGVELAIARSWRGGGGGADTSSTLAEAPTMAMRLPPR
ncbi:MAG TPA: FHA domain-containing protein [Micromonosporaceae bacterium]